MVAGAEADGDARTGADADEYADGRGKVDDGECDGEPGDGVGAHPLADENTVHDVVQRLDEHADDTGEAVLPEQSPHWHRREFA